jgi:septum formation topological specificity factor MinE
MFIMGNIHARVSDYHRTHGAWRGQRVNAFNFNTKLDQTLLLGVRANTIEQLLGGAKSAPDSSIYFHTHRFLNQHQHLSPEPPNDFAYWVSNILGDDVLGERLWSVDIVRFKSIHELRQTLITILQSYLASAPRKIQCQEGEEFHFMASRIFVLPTRHSARDLKEFAEVLGKVSIHSIYFHVFDAKLRLRNDENDFSRWFKSLGKTDLAEASRRLDPYSHTLDGLRHDLIAMVKKYDSH